MALYLRGSAARDDWVPGLSDTDFFMVVRDETLKLTVSREGFYSKLNPIIVHVSGRWPRENPSCRVVPLSHLCVNPVGSYLTGLNARLLMGSDVLAQVCQPSPLDLSRFGAAELDRFSDFWTRRGDARETGNTLPREAAYRQYVVLKLAQTSLLSRNILRMRKEEAADAFAREFHDFDLAHVVDEAQRIRLAWPNVAEEEMRSFVARATQFPLALRTHLGLRG